MRFSTFDKDNDKDSTRHCAQVFKGGWWFNSCHTSLNGLYLGGAHSSYANGIVWKTWHGYYYSLKTTAMMVKKK